MQQEKSLLVNTSAKLLVIDKLDSFFSIYDLNCIGTCCNHGMQRVSLANVQINCVHDIADCLVTGAH